MRLSLLTLTLIGVAGMTGAANAATMTQATPPRSQMVDMRSPPAGRHKVALTDEYGFHYDRWGNRLNSAGYVIAPPHTLPGAHVIQNGRS
ncbi:MAG TPA: hypothetical protein VGM96_27895 [Reyranella sp.]